MAEHARAVMDPGRLRAIPEALCANASVEAALQPQAMGADSSGQLLVADAEMGHLEERPADMRARLFRIVSARVAAAKTVPLPAASSRQLSNHSLCVTAHHVSKVCDQLYVEM